MTVLGIISVPEKSAKIYKRYFKPAIIKQYDGYNNYKIAELNFSPDKLKRLKEKRINKIIMYAEKLLRNNGATHIILSKECKVVLLNRCITERYEIAKTNKIQPHKIQDAFWYSVAKTGGLRRNLGLLIKDKHLNFVSYEYIEKLCTAVKYIALRTDEIKLADELSKKLFCEYGIILNIAENQKDIKSFYMIDFDNAVVRAGDLVIDGAEFISQAPVLTDAQEEAECFGSENQLAVKNWFSGKNKLKIS